MAKGAYIGVEDKARKIKKLYIGVENKARKLKKIYIGDENGKARLTWQSSCDVHTWSITGYTGKDTWKHYVNRYCSECGQNNSLEEYHQYGSYYPNGDSCCADCVCGHTNYAKHNWVSCSYTEITGADADDKCFKCSDCGTYKIERG